MAFFFVCVLISLTDIVFIVKDDGLAAVSPFLFHMELEFYKVQTLLGFGLIG